MNDFQEQVSSIAEQLVTEFKSLLQAGVLGGKGVEQPGVREGASVKRTEAEER